MRLTIGFAGLSLILASTLAVSAAPATAQEWCGFKDKAGAQVHCGYSSAAECKQLLPGKNTVCMPDPSFAENLRVSGKRVAAARF